VVTEERQRVPDLTVTRRRELFFPLRELDLVGVADERRVRAGAERRAVGLEEREADAQRLQPAAEQQRAPGELQVPRAMDVAIIAEDDLLEVLDLLGDPVLRERDDARQRARDDAGAVEDQLEFHRVGADLVERGRSAARSLRLDVVVTDLVGVRVFLRVDEDGEGPG
jgi:hypothetical protein